MSSIQDINADVIYDRVYLVAKQFVEDPPLGVPQFNSIAPSPMRIAAPNQDLPRLGVYQRETARPFTEGIAGTPEFMNTLTITLSGAIKMSDQDEQALILRTLVRELTKRILCDPTLNAMSAHYLGWTRRFNYPMITQTAFAELQMDLMFEYRTSFPPAIVDDYKILHIENQIKGSAGTQVVNEGEYDENGNILARTVPIPIP